MSQSNSADPVKNVVLVHGAFADASGWNRVIPLLQAKGLHVAVVQNPLTSLADDVALTKRVIAAQDGPVVLVGHSYGGAVITEAGNDPKVARLVYVAAFAPDAGQTLVDTTKDFPTMPYVPEVVPQPDGFLMLSAKGMNEDFCQDLSAEERQIMIAAQPLTAGSIFATKITTAAWRTKPSWYVVASNDRMISPDQEKSMAKRINATTTIMSSSHVAMQSHPDEVAEVITQAAA